MKVSMRKDLADEDIKIPACKDVDDEDNWINECYVSAKELIGAALAGGNDDDSHPRYYYERVQLSDGRILFFHGIDLDYELQETT